MIGNWWNMILLPVILLVIQGYIIKREENYLKRAFGEKYLDYKKIRTEMVVSKYPVSLYQFCKNKFYLRCYQRPTAK